MATKKKKANGNGNGKPRHGWQWHEINYTTCGNYVTGTRYPVGAFSVRSCHRSRKAAKDAIRKRKNKLQKAFRDKKLPFMSVWFQVRDRDTGKVLDELKTTKPAAKKNGNPGHNNPKPKVEIDKHAARELELWIDNDYPTYQMKQAVLKNQLRHVKRKKWSLKASTKGFLHLVDQAARNYNKELGVGSSTMKGFDKPTREHVAGELAKEFKADYDSGELDYLK